MGDNSCHAWRNSRANKDRNGKPYSVEYIDEPCSLCGRKLHKWKKVHKGKNGKLICYTCVDGVSTEGTFQVMKDLRIGGH